MHRRLLGTLAAVASFLAHAAATAEPGAGLPPRQMERLGRGVVAVYQGDGKVFVSWRLWGTDQDGIAFNVYRQSGDAAAVRLNDEPLQGSTHFADQGVDLSQPTAYFVRP